MADAIPILAADVSWDIFIRPEEVREASSFPPNRFSQRDERIDFLKALWEGRLPEVELGDNPVIVNLFASYSKRVVDLLTMSQPMAAGFDPAVLLKAAKNCLLDMTRYGGAILWRSGDNLIVPSPSHWYPTREDGDFFISASVSDSADSNREDTLEVIYVPPEGLTERLRFNWDGGSIGSLVSSEFLDEGKVVVVPREPVSGIWGHSDYINLFPLVAEISKRYSTNSRVFDLYTRPHAIFKQSDADAAAAFGGAGDSEAQIQTKTLEAYESMLAGDAMRLEDNVIDLTFVQPHTGGVATALSHVDQLFEVFRTMAGLPMIPGQPMSGVALKLLDLPFYSHSASLQNGARDGLSEVLETEVVWPHVYDIEDQIFNTSAMPMQSEPLMMEVADVPEVTG